jgi:hypothetical protein
MDKKRRRHVICDIPQGVKVLKASETTPKDAVEANKLLRKSLGLPEK